MMTPAHFILQFLYGIYIAVILLIVVSWLWSFLPTLSCLVTSTLLLTHNSQDMEFKYLQHV